MDDLTALTDAEARDLLGRVYAEVQRRDAIANAPAQAEALSATYVAAIGEPGVPDFVQPSGAHDAYQIGDRVRFDCKVYESLIGGNAWSPTAHKAGWKLVG